MNVERLLLLLFALWLAAVTYSVAHATDLTPFRRVTQLSGGMCTEFKSGEWREVKCPAPLTPSQARDILAVSYGQFRGSPTLLDDPPTIHVTAQEKLCGMVHLPAHCPVLGLYESGTIYLSSGLDFSTVEAAAVLVHEYVHHFQEKTRGPVKDCQEWLSREMEAYRIQANVLLKAGSGAAARMVLLAARQMRCSE